MKPAAILLAATLAAHPQAHAENPAPGIDGMLGFNNGDQLHGRLMGIAPGPRVLWQRDDVGEPPAFELANIRRIVLRGGQPEHGLPAGAHAALTNGDRIPGEIVSLDDERVILETSFAGTLAIPREHLGMLSPNPHGGKIHYHGPFAAGEWEILDPPVPFAAAREVDEHGAVIEKPEDENPGTWSHAGAAWYWPGSGNFKSLVRRDTLPDSAVMRFHVAWKSRVSLAIAFHADFHQPEPEADGEGEDGENARRARRIHPTDSSIFSRIFGNCYVLQLNPTHALMYRSAMDEAGNFSVNRMQSGFNSVRLGDAGQAVVEIRASRTTGEISLFINDSFVAQWSEIGHLHEDTTTHGYAGAGNGFGFLMQSASSPARISDITLASWNGLPDAARSMQVADQDIVLLTNGTDRFSGKVTRIADGRLHLDGRYGSLEFPVADVAEIRFAGKSLTKTEDPPPNEIRLRLHPHGIVSGQPRSGDSRTIRIDHPFCGPLDVGLPSAVILEANRGNSFLDTWDPDF